MGALGDALVPQLQLSYFPLPLWTVYKHSWGEGRPGGRGDLDCMAPFPGIISCLAVTLNKMGHNLPGTQTLSAAGATLRVEAEAAVPPGTTGPRFRQVLPFTPAWPVTPAAPLPP